MQARVMIVAGTRKYSNQQHIYTALDEVQSLYHADTMCHGACRGVDTLAAQWAAERSLQVYAFSAQWDRYGRSAGPRRNAEMAQWAVRHGDTILVAFRQLHGTLGTASIIHECTTRGVYCHVERWWTSTEWR
jgi:hypothetical protein